MCNAHIGLWKKTLLVDVEGIISMDFIKGQEYVFLCACTVPLKLSGSRWLSEC